MDNVARLKRQRPWLLIGSGVVIGLALAAFHFMRLGEPQPVGLYVIYWTTATLLAGLIILLGYAQAVTYAARLQILGELADVAGQSPESDQAIGEFQRALENMYSVSLIAFVDAGEDVCISDPTDDDSIREAFNRLLGSAGNADFGLDRPSGMNASDIEDLVGEPVRLVLGESLVFLPGNQPGSKAGTALLAGPRRRHFDEEQLRFMALLWSNVAWAFGIRPAEDAGTESPQMEEFDELLSRIATPRDISEALERMAASVSETALMNETDGMGLILADAVDGKCVASGGSGRLLDWNSSSGLATRLHFEPGDAFSQDGDVVNYSLLGGEQTNGLSPTFKGAVFLESMGLDHLLAAPIMQDAELIGALVAVRGYPYGTFQPEEEVRLTQFAAAAAQPMHKALRLAKEMDRLTRIDRMAAFKSELVYNISHELRTSLSSIKVATDMLLEGDSVQPGSDIFDRLLNSISRNVARQESLVANIVDMAGIEESSLRLKLEHVNLTSVMTETASILAPLISRRSQTLEVSIEPDLPQILADRQRISQILVNLVSNAQKYSPEGSEIAFSAELKGPNVLFTVSDSGPGVPLEERTQVFEPFYRVQDRRAQGVSGSGLGLAITKSLVELHSGSIWIEDGPSGGAAFMVSIPIEGSV